MRRTHRRAGAARARARAGYDTVAFMWQQLPPRHRHHQHEGAVHVAIAQLPNPGAILARRAALSARRTVEQAAILWHSSNHALGNQAGHSLFVDPKFREYFAIVFAECGPKPPNRARRIA